MHHRIKISWTLFQEKLVMIFFWGESYLEMNSQHGIWFPSTWTLDTETIYLFKSIYYEIYNRYASPADLKNSQTYMYFLSSRSLIICGIWITLVQRPPCQDLNSRTITILNHDKILGRVFAPFPVPNVL